MCVKFHNIASLYIGPLVKSTVRQTYYEFDDVTSP